MAAINSCMTESGSPSGLPHQDTDLLICLAPIPKKKVSSQPRNPPPPQLHEKKSVKLHKTKDHLSRNLGVNNNSLRYKRLLGFSFSYEKSKKLQSGATTLQKLLLSANLLSLVIVYKIMGLYIKKMKYPSFCDTSFFWFVVGANFNVFQSTRGLQLDSEKLEAQTMHLEKEKQPHDGCKITSCMQEREPQLKANLEFAKPRYGSNCPQCPILVEQRVKHCHHHSLCCTITQKGGRKYTHTNWHLRLKL